MELQFDKKQVPCLRTLMRHTHEQEQTQEVRLGESLPDIGKILGAWGQVVVRSKDWQAGTVGVSGGVMVWVLYTPESGEGVACVDGWIPFKCKWDIPDTPRDGTLTVIPFLTQVDARATSARRMVLRACVSVTGEAVVTHEPEVYTPPELPDGVQVLKNTYPVLLPAEAGELTFRVEEEFSLPGNLKPGQVLRYEASPEVVDKKVVAGKLVFRGMLLMHLLYEDAEGNIRTHQWDYPFSQYGELEQSYEEDAFVKVTPLVTALELEFPEEGAAVAKVGICGQYTVFCRRELELVEDAYGLRSEVTPQQEVLQLPVVLEDTAKTLTMEATTEGLCSRVVDVTFYPRHPEVSARQEDVQIVQNGHFSVLYYDEEGKLRQATAAAQQKSALRSHRDNQMYAGCCVSGRPTAEAAGGAVALRCDLQTFLQTRAGEGLQMVTGLALGQQQPQDAERPALVLRRAEGDSLWKMAKEEGSTVEEILRANGISGESVPGGMLLIPVLS